MKCGNIFFDEVGGQPVLGDFGLSHSDEADGPETALGETLGPSRWRPPELRSGSSNKRHCGSDIYQLGGVLYEALTGGDAIDDIEQPGQHFRHELNELAISRFTSDPRVEWVNCLLRNMFRHDPDLRISAADVVTLCDEIAGWSQGDPIPRLPVTDEADEAAARYHARHRTIHNQTVLSELRSICDQVSEQVGLLVDAPSNQVSKRLDTNWGDTEPLLFLQNEFPGSNWMAVRARVVFTTAKKHLSHMSYVFIGRLVDNREVVGIYDDNGHWRLLAEGPPGSPHHQKLLADCGVAEVERLLKKIAGQIDRLP